MSADLNIQKAKTTIKLPQGSGITHFKEEIIW